LSDTGAMETDAPVITQIPLNALDKRTTHTGLEGSGGLRETVHQFEAFSFYCEASDQYPEKKINEVLSMVASQFNQAPRTILNWYKNFRWANRYREWRHKQKELSISDPQKKVLEMVKDLEKLTRQGTSILYAWMQSLKPKDLLGKEVELIATIVMRSAEIASKQQGIQQDPQGINIKGHNVQLVIKE
jgi:hypothetical protein